MSVFSVLSRDLRARASGRLIEPASRSPVGFKSLHATLLKAGLTPQSPVGFKSLHAMLPKAAREKRSLVSKIP
jgi:hypothetical protein